MTSYQPVTTKKRGPKPTGKGELIGVRLQPNQLATLDNWIARQDRSLSRPQAVRHLMRYAFFAQDAKYQLGEALEQLADRTDLGEALTRLHMAAGALDHDLFEAIAIADGEEQAQLSEE